jgi:acetyl esterase/lipase
VAPSILRNLNEEPSYRTDDTFSGDRDYYQEVGPWNLARINSKILNNEKTKILILGGSNDSPLIPTLVEYHAWLTQLGIEHTFTILDGVGHEYRAILEGYGENSYAYWVSAFGWLSRICSKDIF